MKITVIGGGNIGTLMAAEFSNKGHDTVIYTSKPDMWGNIITVYDKSDNILFEADNFFVTDNLEEAVKDSEIIFVTLPAQMFADFSKKITPYLKKGQKLGIVPGSGGAEFAFKEVIEKGVTLFGFQRVHSISRLKEYGHSVYMLGRKDELQIAAIPIRETNSTAKITEDLFDMPCVCLPNYLSVTLTPSNPILHTTRLYSLFRDYYNGLIYPKKILFYEEWNDFSSQMLIACDEELQKVCAAIPMNLEKVISLKLHYESSTPQEMTRKICNIPAFKGIFTPMVETDGGWIPDFSSRYFTADFSFGLKIIYDIAKLFQIETPNIDKVWNWYKEFSPEYAEKSFSLSETKESFLKLYLQ